MCVCFMYTLVVRRPSGSLVNAVSRKANFVALCRHGEANGRLLVVEILLGSFLRCHGPRW